MMRVLVALFVLAGLRTPGSVRDASLEEELSKPRGNASRWGEPLVPELVGTKTQIFELEEINYEHYQAILSGTDSVVLDIGPPKDERGTSEVKGVPGQEGYLQVSWSNCKKLSPGCSSTNKKAEAKRWAVEDDRRETWHPMFTMVDETPAETNEWAVHEGAVGDKIVKYWAQKTNDLVFSFLKARDGGPKGELAARMQMSIDGQGLMKNKVEVDADQDASVILIACVLMSRAEKAVLGL